MQYEPDRYRTTFESNHGYELFAFMTEPENLIRMETATYLSRPAIEPLSPFLVQRFGAEIAVDRMKQMMGHMVRQIMEQRGYRLEQGYVSDEAKIKSLKLPTLILWGAKDRLIPPESGQNFARDIAGSKLVMFEALGHVPHEENVQATLAEVVKFLGTRPQDSPLL